MLHICIANVFEDHGSVFTAPLKVLSVNGNHFALVLFVLTLKVSINKDPELPLDELWPLVSLVDLHARLRQPDGDLLPWPFLLTTLFRYFTERALLQGRDILLANTQ